MEYKEFLDELIARSDIVRIVSRYTSLTRKGNTYWGCCPFHHEKTPSFSVSADRGLYHCFGCKAGGNVINFVSEIESVDKGEAIRILAKEANLEVPRSNRADGKNYAAQAAKRERLHNMMREAARHYHDNLYLPQAKEARDYLRRREVPENLVKRFGLGYSVSGGEMIEYLSKLGYTRTEMKEAGLAAQKADEYYDVFYGRLIFPIINNLGEVVSFGGRVLISKPDFAKYRNGSQTVIFDKSRNIYAVNLLKKRKQQKGLDYIIMTEGYMDVISLHKAGFDTAVASMGTALTVTQAKLLKNYCNRIYISYDGDGAGQKATIRGLDILADAGLDVKVVKLPDGPDPDDIIREGGAEAYAKLLDEAVTLTQFKIDVLLKKYDIKKSDEKAKFAVDAARVIKALENPVEREEYLRRLHTLTGYTMEVLYAQTELEPTERKESAPERPAAEPTQAPAMDPSLKFVLASLLADKEYCDFTLDLFPYLEGELAQRIYSRALERFKTGVKTGLASFYEETPEADLPAFKELLDYNFFEGDGADKYAACVKKIAVSALDAKSKALAKRYDETKDVNLLLETVNIQKQIEAIRKGEDPDA